RHRFSSIFFVLNCRFRSFHPPYSLLATRYSLFAIRLPKEGGGAPRGAWVMGRAHHWWSMIFIRKVVSTFRDHALERDGRLAIGALAFRRSTRGDFGLPGPALPSPALSSGARAAKFLAAGS